MLLLFSAILIFCLGYFFAYLIPFLTKKYQAYRAKNPRLKTISQMSKEDQKKYEDFKEKHRAILIKWMREHKDEPPPIVRDPKTGNFHWMPRKIRRKSNVFA